MRWEETDLFSRADTLGNQRVDLGDLTVSDPVFGLEASPRYTGLLERVRESAEH